MSTWPLLLVLVGVGFSLLLIWIDPTPGHVAMFVFSLVVFVLIWVSMLVE